MTDYRIRVSRPIIGHLEGSSAWQEPHATLPDGRPYCDAESVSMVNKIKAASTRPDGSVIVSLDDAERDALAEHTEVQAIGALDNVSGYGGRGHGQEGFAEYMGELNACRALLRKLAKVAATEAMVERLSRR